MPLCPSAALVRRLLFIFIVILKIEHNYRCNLFFIFWKSRQPSEALQLYSYTPRPLLLFFIVIKILKIKNNYQCGFFSFYFLEVTATALLVCFTSYMTSLLLIVIRILFGVSLTIFICHINRHQLYLFIGLLLNLSRRVF
ncbi:Os04g0514150 [Oryza sativa Japonica Group]|uniref:Os04g0514150 protein n=1 Tax=Oryza sativa subsp. japonica TaxID=39947 RepID=A0A0N7KJC9_ORYSJ|nr:hypothetical protein EE612_024386 [Oryza sativa]BAS90065.1 Os04g0514150 [Oryza sativa Japonica Group]